MISAADGDRSRIGDVAAAVTGYASSLRDALDLHTAPILSPAGLWLLLASVAADAGDGGEAAAGVGRVLGLSPARASAAAADLLTAEHPTLAAAVGAWSALPADELARIRARLRSDTIPPIDALPPQAGLDEWARTHTRGLIDEFPLEVHPDTALLLATALVVTPRWAQPMREIDDAWLELQRGITAVVPTVAAGLVGVAVPDSPDGVDVLSVIAAPEIAPARVWEAADEVAAMLARGELPGARNPDIARDGHCWRTVDTEVDLTPGEAEELRSTFGEVDEGGRGAGEDPVLLRWRSRLPVWEARSTHDLGAAPGVEEAAEAMAAWSPSLAGPLEVAQAAMARYDAHGFVAAAVTAMGVRSAMPVPERHRVRDVTVEFAAPHAVLAVARGGAWEGVPVFASWVIPGR